MPPSLHEPLLALFRNDLRLVAELAAPLLGTPTDDLGALRTFDTALTDARPLERRVDLGVVPERGPVYLLEVQLRADSEKLWTWPSYVALTRDRLRREIVLVVLTLSPTVAAWARQPISLGPTGSVLVPLVISPAEIAPLTDATEALAHPERLVLSALAHGRGPAAIDIAEAAARVVGRLDADRAGFYTDLILSALSANARAVLEVALRQGYEYQSEFARRYFFEGLAEGAANGALCFGQELLLLSLSQRGFTVDEALQQRIAAESTPDLLRSWMRRAMSARTLDEVFAAADAPPPAIAPHG